MSEKGDHSAEESETEQKPEDVEEDPDSDQDPDVSIGDSINDTSLEEERAARAEKRRKSFFWMDRRRTALKRIMLAGEHDAAQPLCEELFMKYFDLDLEYCRGDEQVGGRSEEPGAPKNFYRILIRMYANMPDKVKFGSWRLPRWYLESFVKWVEAKGIEMELRDNYRTPEIVELAVARAVETKMFTELIVRIFALDREQLKTKAIEMVKHFLSIGDYRHAQEYMMNSDIVDHFSFFDIGVPLVMQQNFPQVFTLIENSAQMQIDYLTFLDDLIDRTDPELEEKMQPWREKLKMEIPAERFKLKNVYTLIQKFFNRPANQFKSDLREERDAPRFTIAGKRKALGYFYKLRYEEKKISDANYAQHVTEILRTGSLDLSCWFLSLLWDKGLAETKTDAISWMILYNIPRFDERICEMLQQFFTSPDYLMMADAILMIHQRHACGVVEEGETLYLNEEKKEYPIILIKTEDRLDELIEILENLRKSGEPVNIGYDSEMNNVHFLEEDQMVVSLIQLFFHGFPYVVDCLELDKNKLPIEKWKRFVESLFEAPNFKIIGFDVRSDFATLLSRRGLVTVYDVDKINNGYCIKTLYEFITEVEINAFGLDKKTCKLSELVKCILGFTMNKQEQISNWQKRPLRKEQIVYAATDAYVVIELFDKVLDIGVEKLKGTSREELLRECNVNCPKKPVVEKERKQDVKTEDMSWPEMFQIIKEHRDPNKPLKRPSEVKFILDVMLAGMARYLKCIGMDVISTSGNKELRELIAKNQELPVEERRHIITVSPRNYEEFQKENPDTAVYLPMCTECNAFERFLNFLDVYNFDIREDDFGFLQKRKKKSKPAQKLKKSDR